MQEEQGLSIEAIDEAVAESKTRADGARSCSPTCSGSTRSCTSPSTCDASYGDRFYVHGGMRELVARGQARRQERRRRLLPQRRRAAPGRRRPRSAGARRALHPEGVRRGVPRARGGRRLHQRHRPRDDGRRRPDPAAVRARRRDRPRRRRCAALETAAGEWGERFAPPLILRRLVAQGRLGAKAGQGFFAYPRPDAEASSRARPSSSRPAATSRSRGSTTRR